MSAIWKGDFYCSEIHCRHSCSHWMESGEMETEFFPFNGSRPMECCVKQKNENHLSEWSAVSVATKIFMHNSIDLIFSRNRKILKTSSFHVDPSNPKFTTKYLFLGRKIEEDKYWTDLNLLSNIILDSNRFRGKLFLLPMMIRASETCSCSRRELLATRAN